MCGCGYCVDIVVTDHSHTEQSGVGGFGGVGEDVPFSMRLIKNRPKMKGHTATSFVVGIRACQRAPLVLFLSREDLEKF
jgi:hypothetical protein